MAWDVRAFDLFAGVYDLAMPAADASVLRPALDLSTRDLERVVDLGGGTGRAVRALDVPTPLVVDAARGMAERARDHGLPAAMGDASRLPLQTASVDAVLVVDALHHFADAPAALGEAARVLRPGGVVVVREFDPATLRGRALVAAEHGFGFDSTFFTPGSLSAMLADEGLETSVTDEGFAYTVAGRKPSSGSAEVEP